jgi:DNA primase
MNNIKQSIDSFNLFDYLQSAGLDMTPTAGGHEYIAECFNCFRKKLYIHAFGEKKGLWHCFKCNKSGNVFDLVSEIEGIDRNSAFKKIVGKKEYIADIKQIEFGIKEDIGKDFYDNIPIEVKFPINYTSLLSLPDNHTGKLYARQRGISDDDMVFYKLMYSPSEARLVFPVYYKNVLIGWQGRDATGKSDVDKKYPKAVTLPSKRDGKGFKKSHCFYNWDNVVDKKFITIVEGPIDCIKGRYVNSVALFGKEISDFQFKMLLTLKNLKCIFIALDMDAHEDRLDLASKLSPFYDVRMVNLPEDRDFGDCTQQETVEYVKQAKAFTNRFILQL